jgi:hypothetical protein
MTAETGRIFNQKKPDRAVFSIARRGFCFFADGCCGVRSWVNRAGKMACPHLKRRAYDKREKEGGNALRRFFASKRCARTGCR